MELRERRNIMSLTSTAVLSREANKDPIVGFRRSV